MIGPEHEFSINDENFNPVPISDRIIKTIRGRIANEATLSKVIVNKELQKHVIELKPLRPFESLSEFEEVMQEGVNELLSYLDGFKLLGLGMHPLLRLENAVVWDHRDKEIYETYDRIFNIRQHEWLNIQSFQLNISYKSEKETVELHNRIRSILPYLASVSASSPICEGKVGFMDSRLHFYRINQKRILIICNDIIPEKISSLREYRKILENIYSELKKLNGEILCREWVNSRGVIIRFSRKCLEIRIMDEQECIKSDVALSAFAISLIRSEFDFDRETLLKKLEYAIISGTDSLKDELRLIL